MVNDVNSIAYLFELDEKAVGLASLVCLLRNGVQFVGLIMLLC